MVKNVFTCTVLLCIYFMAGCNNNILVKNTQNCQVIKMMHDTFMKIHSHDFKHMNFDRSYICNFDNYETDTPIGIKTDTFFSNSVIERFNKNELISIGTECLQIQDISYLDSDAAIDTLMSNKTTNKIILGITNYRRNENTFT